MLKCKNCYHKDICTHVRAYNFAKNHNLDHFLIGHQETVANCENFKDKSLIVELPVPVESYVFVSPNNGKNFHKAIIYGMNKKGSYLVRLCDDLIEENEKHIVKNPSRRIFYDWFFKIYTREDAEKALNAENTV